MPADDPPLIVCHGDMQMATILPYRARQVDDFEFLANRLATSLICKAYDGMLQTPHATEYASRGKALRITVRSQRLFEV